MAGAMLLLTLLFFTVSSSGAQSVARVADCLRQSGIATTHISLPTNPSFNVSLSETLIQDPIADPRIFVRPGSTAEVRSVVQCAARTGTVFCSRSGGHSWGSASSCPGLVLDLKRMTAFSYNSARKLAVIQAGKTIGESLYELYTRTGRIFPVGTCPSVGIGGYALGGGIGVFTEDLGLLSDNIITIRGVTPTGSIFTATRTREPELFWALRGGGGGNFGVVTEFVIKTTSAQGTFDNNVYFAYSWPSQQAAKFAKAWVDDALVDDTKTTIRGNIKITSSGVEVTAKGVCWRVSSEAACMRRLRRLSLWSVPGRTTLVFERSLREGTLEALKFFGSDPPDGPTKPAGPATSPAYFGERYRSNRRLELSSWGSALLDPSVQSASEAYFDQLIRLAVRQRRSSGMRSLFLKLYPFGGKGRQPDTSSAFPYRATRGVVLVLYNGGQRARRTAAKRRVQSFLSRYQSGTYVNYLDVDLNDYRNEYFGSGLSRLRRLKQQLDPERLAWHPFPITSNRL